jgi:6-phosphogluconolactonase/glucosamine-6-phosphate isomerase/deaminase
MLGRLAEQHLPWERVHVFMVDERMGAPEADQNGPRVREALSSSGLPSDHLHLIWSGDEDLETAAAVHEDALRALSDGTLDCIQLGLGPDGHTASLVPGDPVLDVQDRLVAVTARPYQGYRRITLTYPALARARAIVWLVNGEEKADVLPLVRAHDPAIPAGRVPAERAILVCDRAAAVRMEVP